MELQIAVEELARALHRAQGIVDKKSAMPILANVLLDAHKGGLTVTAFDLEIGVVSEHKAEVREEGRVAVSAKHLYDIVKALGEPIATLKTAANHYVELRCGASFFKLVGMSPDDYPALPKSEKISFAEIDPKILLEMIEKTAFAVSTDETRYNLNGVYLEPVESGLRMVSTDGHRLAMVERPLGAAFPLKKGVIIPRKGLAELRRLLSEDSGTCELGFADTSGVFRKPGLTMVMRLIDGHFPDYRHVLPKESDKHVKVGRQRLQEVLKRVSLLSQDQSYTVKLELTEGKLRIASSNPDLGEAHEELAVDHANGTLTAGFNARYILDVLSVIGADEVRLELNDELSPGVIKAEGDAGYTAVIMPVRI